MEQIKKTIAFLKEKQVWNHTVETTKNFFRTTSLHGFKHIPQTYNRSSGVCYALVLSRSIIWIVITGLSVSFCILLMALAWDKYQNSPTHTILKDIYYPISKVPFPAVTVCDNNRVTLSRTKNLTTIL